MKTTTKLTPWFTNGEKPVHIGVYNVSCRKVDQTGDWYSYWDGRDFNYFTDNIEQAYDRQSWPGPDVGSWRGLAEDSSK